MNRPDFYLASPEGYGLKEPRCGWRVKRMSTEQRDDLLLIKVDPPLSGKKYGLETRDIDLLLVAPRHLGASLFPINEWPISVHVARPLIDHPELRDRLRQQEYVLIAWAELYRTEADARSEVM